MTTLTDVQEGKSNYFTLEEIDGGEIIFVESVDVTAPLRSHKVEGKGEGKKKDAEYFDFAVSFNGAVKDIGLTYTGLKQLSEVVPKDLKNWQGIRVKYSGTKGTGKNIKYKWDYLGIAAKGTYTTAQTSIPGGQEPTDAAGKLIKTLKTAPAGLLDKPFWEAVQQAIGGGTIYESTGLVEKLKTQGLITKMGDFWKAT